MKRAIINTNFNSALQKKIPNKSQLTNALADILLIEKEAIYRRLREEVPFSFGEVALISQELGISLDKIVGINSDKSKPFNLLLSDFEFPSKVDYVMWENYVRMLEIFKNNSPFCICETWRTLPFPLCYKFPLLTKYYVYLWAYQSHNHTPARTFESMSMDENIINLGIDSWKHWVYATETHYILAEDIFKRLVKDISFFRYIRLMSEDSVQALIKEMYACIDYMEKIATRGTYEETGNKVYIYVSGIDIQTEYSLLEANGNYISMLRALVMTSAATIDETTSHHMKNWFMSLKRFSAQISVSGERERIQFFKKQREAITLLEG